MLIKFKWGFFFEGGGQYEQMKMKKMSLKKADI